MKIINARPYPTAVALGKFSPSEPFLALLIKASFSMDAWRAPARAAQIQIPIQRVDDPYDPKDPTSPLRFESDLVPFKPRADIILVGSAYAPDGQPTKVVDVQIRVGNVERNLRAFGDRVWSYPTREQHAPIVAGPAEFVEMPLTYARAFGGIDKHAGLIPEVPHFRPWCARNFSGRGFIGALSVDSVHQKPLPNIEDPRSLIDSYSTYPAPVGCGYFPRNSEPRSSYAGTYDDRWKAERAPEAPLDFRFDFFNAADPSLQVDGFLRGDEPVVLSNVARDKQRFEFYLPGIRPLVTVRSRAWSSSESMPVEGGARSLRTIDAKLDTLVMIPDRKVFFQIWRATVPIVDPAALEIESIRIDYEQTPAPGASAGSYDGTQ